MTPKIKPKPGYKRAFYINDKQVPLRVVFDMFTYTYAERVLQGSSWSNTNLYLHGESVKARFESTPTKPKESPAIVSVTCTNPCFKCEKSYGSIASPDPTKCEAPYKCDKWRD